MEILDRVLARLPGEDNQADEPFLKESIRLVEDRLNLRLNTDKLPDKFESILVDAVIKIWRRRYHEGIETEKIDTINTKFVDNILEEYEKEIQAYLYNKEKDSFENVVRFI